MEITKEKVLEILKKIKHPETAGDIVSSNMVENLRIDGRQIIFTLALPKPNDPFFNSIKKLCDRQLKKKFGKDVEVMITVPVKVGPLKTGPEVLPEVKNVIVVASGKGGVGKSMVAANLAVTLAKQGWKTGLLDADIFGPSVPKMMDLEGSVPRVHKVNGIDMIIPLEKYGMKILSIGFFINTDDALVWRGPMATSALKQLLQQGDWGELDFLIVDLPPGTSDIHLTMVQEIPVTGALMVTTPQDVALADVIRGIAMFRSDKIEVPVLGLVENMAWFTPEEMPDKKYYIFGEGGARKIAEKYNVPVLANIPIVQKIRESGDAGRPVALDEDTMPGQIFQDLAARFVEQVDKRNKELPPTKKVIIQR
ncbi:MAG TPA: MRP family ATP-binding protein [Bacteroidetes bacterium]|nr:MRP family ATP-binding protein [Bacteroidota bacterium]